MKMRLPDIVPAIKYSKLEEAELSKFKWPSKNIINTFVSTGSKSSTIDNIRRNLSKKIKNSRKYYHESCRTKQGSGGGGSMHYF